MDRPSRAFPPCDTSRNDDRLRRYLAVRFSSLADPEDLIQEAYVRLYRIPDPRAVRDEQAFLFITVRNLAFDHIRRRKHSPLIQGAGEDIWRKARATKEALDDIHRSEILALLRRAVDSLPPRCRTVLRLHRLRELPQKTIAKRLRLSGKTVENHVARGYRGCAEFLRRHGVHSS